MAFTSSPLQVTDNCNALFLDPWQQKQGLEDEVVHFDETLKIIWEPLKPVYGLEDDQNTSIPVHMGHHKTAVGAVKEGAVVLNGMAGQPSWMALLELIVGVDGLVRLYCIPPGIVKELG